MKNLVPLTLFVAIIAMMNCSTAKTRVLPGPEGKNKAISRDIEKDGAEVAAVRAANEYCKDKRKEAIFTSQNSQYTRASAVGYSMTSDRDYEAQVDFKCQ